MRLKKHPIYPVSSPPESLLVNTDAGYVLVSDGKIGRPLALCLNAQKMVACVLTDRSIVEIDLE